MMERHPSCSFLCARVAASSEPIGQKCKTCAHLPVRLVSLDGAPRQAVDPVVLHSGRNCLRSTELVLTTLVFFCLRSRLWMGKILARPPDRPLFFILPCVN